MHPTDFCCHGNCNQGRNCPLTDGETMKKSHYTTPRTFAECEFSGRDTTQGYTGDGLKGHYFVAVLSVLVTAFSLTCLALS